jgi:hypothetical protein
MSILQRLIADVSNTTAQLVAQLRELDQLREQVEKAQLSADRRQNRRRPNGNRAASRTPLNRPSCESVLAETDVAQREPQPTVLG